MKYAPTMRTAAAARSAAAYPLPVLSAMKNLVGGEVEAYTELFEQARQIATKRMADEAEAMGADAVIGVRYTSSSLMQGAAEVTAYGTAVRFLTAG